MSGVRAGGDRSVAVGGDAGLVVTGDNNLVFRGEYEEIGEAYLDHSSVFARLELQHFVGREEVIRDIDELMARSPRGYVVVEGEAGIGKSALLARLVVERGYPHHFVELTPGLSGVGHALKSLAAQLVRAYGLNPHGVIPAGAAMQPYYLASLLGKAAARRSDRKSIVVVVDGLDQSGTPEDQNVLGLPSTLPDGVFLIVSQRPMPLKLVVAAEVPRSVFTLRARDEQNERDLGRYVEAAYERLPPPGPGELKGGLRRANFIEQIVKKCGGRWQHMVLIVREIEAGMRSARDLDTVPSGLVQQYCALYRRCRESVDPDSWEHVLRPLMTLIAAAKEPPSQSMLEAWTGSALVGDVMKPLIASRPAMVVADGPPDKPLYRIEHSSLSDMLHGRTDPDLTLTASEREILDEATRATLAAHEQLVSFYLRRFETLREQSESGPLSPVDAYGLTHVFEHIYVINRHDQAVALLSQVRETTHAECRRFVRWLPFKVFSSVKRRRHFWTQLRTLTGTWADVASDVDRVWHAEKSTSLAVHLRLALLHASLMGRITSLPSLAAAELVRLGIWSAQQSVEFAIASLRGRSRENHGLLAALAEALVERGEADAALATAYMSEHGNTQAKILGAIVSRLPAEFASELFDRFHLFLTAKPRVMNGLREETEGDLTAYGLASIRGDAAAALAPAFTPTLAMQALDIVRTLPPLARIFASTPLIMRLDETERPALTAELHDVARAIEDERSRLFGLARLAQYLSPAERNGAIDVIVSTIAGAPGDHSVLLAIAQPALVKALPPRRVLDLIKRVDQRTALLTGEESPDPLFVEAALDAQDAAALIAAAPHLTDVQLRQALKRQPASRYAHVGLALLARLPPSERVGASAAIAHRLREDARGPDWPSGQAQLPADLARFAELVDPQRALELARIIRSPRIRGAALARLARFSQPDEQAALLDEAINMVVDVDNQKDRLKLVIACEVGIGHARKMLTEARQVAGYFSREYLSEFAEHAVAAGAPDVAIDALTSVDTWSTHSIGGDTNSFNETLQRIPAEVVVRALVRWRDAKKEQRAEDTLVARSIAIANDAGPDSARELSTQLDGLMNIPTKNRTTCLTFIISYLPPASIDEGLRRGLTQFLNAEELSAGDDARLLDALVSRLAAPGLRQLLSVARLREKTRESTFQPTLLAAMRVIQLEQPDDLDRLGAMLGSCYRQHQVLAALRSIVSDEVLLSLFSTGDSWTTESAWAPAIANLARFFAARGQHALGLKLLEAIDVRCRKDSRLAMIDMLPVAAFTEFWSNTFLDICEPVDGLYDLGRRQERLRRIVPILLQMSTSSLTPLVIKGLHALALQGSLVATLRPLVPVLARVGGPELLRELIDANREIGEWFP